MNLPGALSSLGHEEFRIRNEASIKLEKGGWESMALFDELKTEDPEILTRVNKIREVISLGLHENGSPELRAALLNLSALAPAKSVALIARHEEELRECPLVLAGLHSRILKLDWKPKELAHLRKAVEKELRWVFRKLEKDYSRFDPTHYSAETCAFLFDNLNEFRLEESNPIYLKWLAVHPTLPDYFRGKGILLELRRLQEGGEIQTALKRLASLEDQSFFIQQGKLLADWIKLEPYLETVPSLQVCLVLLNIHFRSNEPESSLPAYRIFLKAHPEISEHLGKRLTILEVLRLRLGGHFYETYSLLEKISEPSTFRRREIENLAIWARSNRDQLKSGFPPISARSERMARVFFSHFVRIHPNDTFLESEREAREVSRILKRTTNKEEWREMIKPGRSRFLSVYLLLEEKRLWPELTRPVEHQTFDLEPEVGRFLMEREELLKEMPIRDIEVDRLQVILGGLLWDLKIDQLKFALRMGKQWEKIYPDVLRRKGSEPFEKLGSYRKWISGDHGGAIEILSKSEMENFEKGWLLDHFLRKEIVPSIGELLEQSPLTTSAIHSAFRKLVEPDGASDAAVRNAFQLLAWNLKSGDAPEENSPSLSDVSTHALRAWMAGNDEQAYDYMEMVFWNYGLKADSTNRRFPLWSVVLGRADDAIAKILANKDSIRDPEVKLAYLLYASGKFQEALKYRGVLQETPLLRDLLIAVEDWEALASLSLPDERERRKEVRIAWCHVLRGDSKIPKPTFHNEGNEYRDLMTMLSGDSPPVPSQPPLPPLTLLKNLKDPQIGSLKFPRKKEFSVLDTFVEIRRLWLSGEQEKARNLSKSCFSRLVLDEGCEGSRVRFFEQTEKGSRSAKMGLGASEMALFAARELELPRTLVGPVVGALAQLPTPSSSDCSSLASRYFQWAGDEEQARRELHFSLMGIEVESLKYPMSRLAMLFFLQAVDAVNRRDFAQVEKSMKELVKHAPHQNNQFISIIRSLQGEQSDLAAGLVSDFWREQIKKNSEEEGFQKAQEKWLKRSKELR